MKTSPRTHVDQVIGRADHILVMLHYDHGIAEIAESPQRLDQFPVVPLVQPYRRLVEHVEHTHQVRADLGGKPDALGFPAGHRTGIAGEGEIPQPDLFQKIKTGPDLLDDLAGNLSLFTGKFQIIEERDAATDGKICHIDDRFPVYPDSEHLLLEPLSLAGRTVKNPHVTFQLAFPPFGLGLGVEPGGLGEKTLPLPVVRPLGIPVLHAHGEMHPLL